MSIKNFKNILILMMVVFVAFSLLTGCSSAANTDTVDGDADVNEAASDDVAADEAADSVQSVAVVRYGPF